MQLKYNFKKIIIYHNYKKWKYQNECLVVYRISNKFLLLEDKILLNYHHAKNIKFSKIDGKIFVH